MSKKAVARAKNASIKHPATKRILVTSTTVGALIIAAFIAADRKS
jgi:hypothetical protein